MLSHTIGENAGRVYRLLEGSEPRSPTAIARALKLSGNDVAYALGWLAREEKLSFQKAGSGVKVALRYH
jgi:hypothetical protein